MDKKLEENIQYKYILDHILENIYLAIFINMYKVLNWVQ